MLDNAVFFQLRVDDSFCGLEFTQKMNEIRETVAIPQHGVKGIATSYREIRK